MIAAEFYDGDTVRLDEMVNVEGVDQVTACQMLWGHLPVRQPVPLIEPPAPPADATPAQHSAWVRSWVRHLVARRLADVLAWLEQAGGARA
jgi:hypothetical protein